MRKRNILKIADTIFWYVIYLLPIISYIAWCFSFVRSPSICDLTYTEIRSATNFGTFLTYSRFEIAHTNIIYTTLYNIFGNANTGAVFRIFSNDILMIFAWFIGCTIVHLFVDVILFIPRFAMKWMDEFTKE